MLSSSSTTSLRIVSLLGRSRPSLSPPLGLWCRRMADGRNYYVKDGSNATGITPQIRDLMKNRRHAENRDEWAVEPGIQEPIRFDMTNEEDIDDDQSPDLVYWPHKGEVLDPDYKPPPIFLVKRVKKFGGVPYYHRETLGKLGIGERDPMDKTIVVPNLPTMCAKLYTVKHLIEVTPLTFPMGFPEDDEFDPAACRISPKGEFFYNPKLKVDLADPETPMKIQHDHIQKVATKHWFQPWNTPLGNSNYHRNMEVIHPELKDCAHDPSFIARQKFTHVPHKEGEG